MPRKDKIWVGTFEHGLDVLDRNSGRVIKHYSANDGRSGLHSNFIFSFYEYWFYNQNAFLEFFEEDFSTDFIQSIF